MNNDPVNFTVDSGVALISMNRPESLNALSRELCAGLAAAVGSAPEKGARAAVLTGSERAYCSGGDLREMRQFAVAEGRPEKFLEEPLKELHQLVSLIRTTPIPFVAAVSGACAGAGTNLALACDIVFAAENATFNEAFVRIGLSPDCGGSFFLPRAVGEKRAAEIFMTGMSIDAATALSFGMINRVVAGDSLVRSALEFARGLANGPTGAIGRIKRLLNASFSNDLDEQLALEHTAQRESGRSNDFKEGLNAFFEKRQPNFTDQ
ncbi:MAG: enoyl-CoA hydratase-related protein [Acidobacteriota bacterium]